MTITITQSDRKHLVRGLMEGIEQMTAMRDNPATSATSRTLCNGHIRRWTALIEKIEKKS